MEKRSETVFTAFTDKRSSGVNVAGAFDKTISEVSLTISRYG